MAIIKDLISYWKLDEASGDATDSHGSHDLTNSGASYGSTGVLNDCFDFEATEDDYCYVSYHSDFDVSSVSMQAWIYIEANPNEKSLAICGKENGNEGYLMAYMHDSGGGGSEYFFAFRLNATIRRYDCGDLTGGWHHMVATYDGSNVKLYIDGDKKDTIADASGITNPNTYFGVGRVEQWGTNHDFDGLIDEVGIWSRALDDDEVTALYNSGNGLPYPFTNMKINISDSWKYIKTIQINIGDTWKEVDGIQINIGDAWKNVF